ncbi:hypothetical protein [Fodinicola feengrottensis]|nr:hypothetical protein [Fodinicola feengrottensis]
MNDRNDEPTSVSRRGLLAGSLATAAFAFLVGKRRPGFRRDHRFAGNP